MSAQDRYGVSKDGSRNPTNQAVEAVLRSATQSVADNNQAGEHSSEGGGNIRTSLLGHPEGTRQRYFRKAKAATRTAGVRLLPEKVDRDYTQHVGKAAAAEFIAILVFVFISAGSVESFSTLVQGRPEKDSASVLAIALAHGISLAIAIAISATYSGGHVNPAVTLGFIVTGRLDILAGVVYWVAQIVGAVVGALLLYSVWGTPQAGLGAHTFAPGVSTWRGLEVEILLTFFLVLTFWATAIDPRGNKTLAPILIGLSLFVDVIFGAWLTGASTNPARSFGPALVSGIWAHHWVYWIGPFLGAVTAAVVYDLVFIRTTDHSETDDIYEEILAQEEGRA